MIKFKFDSKEYLHRINLDINVKPTKECLYKIHQAQHRSIPFENFDIALGHKIDLSENAIFNKLVRSKRGGYCFELNKLFLLALNHYGFESRPLLSRVHVTGNITGRGHLISLVTIKNNQWIVDTGFGAETPSEPLPLILDVEIITSSGKILMLVEDDLYGIMLKIKNNNEWNSLYSFDLGYVCAGDIDYGNFFTSSHPSSFFVSACVAALPLENGMVTLFNNRITKKYNEEVLEIDLPKGSGYFQAIKKFFDIEIEAAYSDLKSVV